MLLYLFLLVSSGTAVERHFNFTVLMRLSMEYGMNCAAFGQHCEPSYRAYEREGKLYYHNSSANTGAVGIELPVPETADVLVVDGTVLVPTYRTDVCSAVTVCSAND